MDGMVGADRATPSTSTSISAGVLPGVGDSSGGSGGSGSISGPMFLYGSPVQTTRGELFVFYDNDERSPTLDPDYEPLHTSQSDGMLIKPVARHARTAVWSGGGGGGGGASDLVRAHVVVRRRTIDGVREAVIYRSSSLPRIDGAAAQATDGAAAAAAAVAMPLASQRKRRIHSMNDLLTYTAARIGEERYVVAFPKRDALRAVIPPPLMYVRCSRCTALRRIPAQRGYAFACGAMHADTAAAHLRHCGGGGSGGVSAQFSMHPLPARWADEGEGQ